MNSVEVDSLISNIISSAIKSEWDAIDIYNSSIVTLESSEEPNADKIIKILEDIRDEEYVHVGQLESCLSLLRDNPTEQIEDGSEEGFEQLELPEDDEEPELELEEDLDDDKEHLFETNVNERLDKDVIKDMDIEEVKKRLLAVGFDAASFMGKSDKELRAMLKISRRARGDQAIRKWKKDGKVFLTDSKESSIQEEKKSTLSEEEMKQIICGMIDKYDASEEETFDELQSHDSTITKDLVHRLYRMCNKNKVTEEKTQSSFDDMWEELDDMED